MKSRKIASVVNKILLKEANEEDCDLQYWLSKSVKERASAVTFLISFSLEKGQRIDKTKVIKKQLAK